MTERTLKIEQRLHHVKRELCEQGISKSKQTNFGGKYKYRGVDSTMGTVSALHAKYGVNFSIDRIEHFAVAQQGNNTHITCLFVFRFSSCDDKSEYVEHTCIGEGLDQGDKASGKAHSYAYKNGMFSFYEIPVEGQNVDDYDPRIDNEDDSDEIPIPMPQNVKDEIDKHKPEPKKAEPKQPTVVKEAPKPKKAVAKKATKVEDGLSPDQMVKLARAKYKETVKKMRKKPIDLKEGQKVSAKKLMQILKHDPEVRIGKGAEHLRAKPWTTKPLSQWIGRDSFNEKIETCHDPLVQK